MDIRAVDLNLLKAFDALHAEATSVRVLDKLRTEPVEDLRIDFEDGYGARPEGLPRALADWLLLRARPTASTR